MGFFRRRHETLNEQLLREAGLDLPELQQTQVDAPQRKQTQVAPKFEPAPGGLAPDLWDAFVIANAPGLDSDEVLFWALPEGDLLVAAKGTANVSVLADAVEKKIERPYKALAGRQDEEFWAVGATPVDIANFAFAGGDSVTLALTEDEGTTFEVDGTASEAAVPEELQAAGEEVGPSFFVEADRIDGDVWEVRAAAL